MKKLILILILLISLESKAQYKSDNVLFKTVYPQDLCLELKKNPGFFFLDVRSKGEYEDSSRFVGLNIGRIKGAYNITVQELGKRLNEIVAYKDAPVFVYCSHSQRSRRASKLLADSGFTHIINVNGGMTAIQQFTEGAFTCLDGLVEERTPYAVLSALQICRKMGSNNTDLLIMDVRSDSSFAHISRSPLRNAYGYFRGSLHIALNDLKTSLDRIPFDKDIVITDEEGDDAPLAASLLAKNGYKKLSLLVEGFERYLNSDKNASGCSEMYLSPVKYSITNAQELSSLLERNKATQFLDIRPDDEFNNKSSRSFRNIGQIRGALHIPAGDIEKRWNELIPFKNKPLIIYHFGNDPVMYEIADSLQNNGFTQVYVLAGGYFDLRWTGHNVKGFEGLLKWEANVPDENK